MKNRRRKFLINKKMQFELMAFTVIPMLLGGAGLYYLLYYFIANEMVIPEAIVQILLPAMGKVNLLLLVIAPIMIFAVLRSALVYSNKIAGPLYRIEKELDEITATRDFKARIRLRKGDQLHSTADKANRLLEKMEVELLKVR